MRTAARRVSRYACVGMCMCLYVCMCVRPCVGMCVCDRARRGVSLHATRGNVVQCYAMVCSAP